MSSRYFWSAALVLHLALIGGVSCSDIVEIIGTNRTVLPGTLAQRVHKLSNRISGGWSGQLVPSNFFGQTLTSYCHITGIDAPYSFFAPEVAEAVKVVFEIHFPDQQISYQLLSLRSRSEALRLDVLIDQAAAKPGFWRDVVLQMLAASAANKNPEATKIQVMIASLKIPRPADYRNGVQPSYEPICSYNFLPDQARRREQ